MRELREIRRFHLRLKANSPQIHAFVVKVNLHGSDLTQVCHSVATLYELYYKVLQGAVAFGREVVLREQSEKVTSDPLSLLLAAGLAFHDLQSRSQLAFRNHFVVIWIKLIAILVCLLHLKDHLLLELKDLISCLDCEAPNKGLLRHLIHDILHHSS